LFNLVGVDRESAQGDLEPQIRELARIERFGKSLILRVVSRDGIEPSTRRLRDAFSEIEKSA
jgi:hypothetical protein